jgi:hypothetical protein
MKDTDFATTKLSHFQRLAEIDIEIDHVHLSISSVKNHHLMESICSDCPLYAGSLFGTWEARLLT